MAEDEIVGAKSHLCKRQKTKSEFKSKKEEKEEEEEIPYLAVDLVINILLRLPANLLMRYRQVCLAWCEVIDSPSFAHKHQTSYNMKESQVLYYEPNSHGRSLCGRNLCLLKIDEPIYSFRRIRMQPMIAGLRNSYPFCRLDYLGYGLFYVRYKGQTFLYKPIRGQMLILPPTILSASYGLGFDSTTNSYKLVNVFLHDGNKYWIQVYTLGTSSWRRISPVPRYFYWYFTPVPAYGDVHWKSKDVIVSLDVKKEEFKATPLPYCLPHQETQDYNLFDWRGALAVVYTSFSSYFAIWVLKDYDNSRWAKDYNIRSALLSRWGVQVSAWNDCMVIGVGEKLFYYDPKSDGLTTLDNHGFRYVNGSRMINYTGNLISLKNYGYLV